MAETNLELIIDGDGHLVEDIPAIAALMREEWIPKRFVDRQAASGSVLNGIFPAGDHLHAATPIEYPPHSFEQADAKGWLAFADEVGIDSTVLYPSAGLGYGRITNREWAIAVCMAYNDWVYETYTSKSPRFKAMGLIPMQDPPAAAEELRRIVNDLGLPGAMLPSPGLSKHLGAKEFWPVYEEANRLGCALAVHGGGHSGFGFDTYEVLGASHSLGHPLNNLVAFAGIIFNGCIDKYENVNWAFLEGGIGWFIMCMERFDRSYESHKHYDPRGEMIQLQNGEKISDYIRRFIDDGRIYVGVEGSEPFLDQAIQAYGNKFPVFSSDFPHEVNKEICAEEIQEILDSPVLSNEDKAGVLNVNSQRLYKLSPVNGNGA